MLLIPCPHCGLSAEETEFAPGGEAHLERFGPGSDDAAFTSYMFERENPKGVVLERWRHAFGCGKWFHLARASDTLEIFGAYRADELPPEELRAKIDARRGTAWRTMGRCDLGDQAGGDGT